MNSDQAHQQAERNFKKEERARDGRQAMIEYEVQARATRAKTERLKALRLARLDFKVRSCIGTDSAQLRKDEERPPRSAKLVADIDIGSNPGAGDFRIYRIRTNRECQSAFKFDPPYCLI